MFSKKEGVIMKRWSFILAVILIISFCFTGCQNQQMLSVEEYNAKYAKTIDFEKGIDNKTFGNADYRVFLAGEYHAQTKGYQSKKMLIQYLHEKQDVDYLICELGMGQGFLLDDYIQTGNEENLIFMMEELEGTLAYTQDEYQLWKWLHDYNQQQPENDKLHIIGLDIEFQKKTSVRGLSLLMDNSVTPAKEIQPLIERIKESDGTAVKEFPQTLEKYPEQMSGLSDREREVARLAAEGLRNREIAQRLFISEETVKSHIRSIFNKTNIDRRSKLVDLLK